MNVTDRYARPILMVEDLDFDYEMTERGFRRLGVQAPLVRRSNLASATAYIQSHPDDAQLPSIIILDLNLRDGDGRELLAQLKNTEHLKNIPVVVWSASSDPAVIDECYREGASSYIRKAADRRITESAIEQFVLYWLQTASLPSERN